MAKNYPVFDEGSGALFGQKLCDNLLFGISFRSTHGFEPRIHVLASLINLMPPLIAIVFSQFPGRLWAYVVSLVLSLCMSVMYGLFSCAAERFHKAGGRPGSRRRSKDTSQGQSKGSTAGAVGAVLFPATKGACAQTVIQLYALSLATVFFTAVYYGVATRWVSIFMAMLWSPALRGIDTAMNVFVPGQIFECTFTNLFYTFCLYIPSTIFLTGPRTGHAHQIVKWVNVAYALVPPLSFFGILPQFRCLILYIFDLTCRITKIPAFGGWSILLFPNIILTVIGTGFAAFIPSIFYVLMNIKYSMAKHYTTRILIRLLLFTLAAISSGIIAIFSFLEKAHIKALPVTFINAWFKGVSFFVTFGIGAGCYLIFQVASLFARNTRTKSRAYMVANHVVGFLIFVFGVVDVLVAASSYVRSITHTDTNSSGPIDYYISTIYIPQAFIYSISTIHFTMCACTDPASLYTSMLLGGLVLGIAHAVLQATGKLALLVHELQPKHLPVVAFGTLVGSLVDGFIHRLVVSINFYVFIAKFALSKPRQRWGTVILWLMPLIAVWNLIVLLVSALLNIPPLPIGGTPILVFSYPRYSQFFYTSIGTNLTFGDRIKTVIYSVMDSQNQVHPDDIDDIFLYDSALQGLSGRTQSTRSPTSFCSLYRAKLNAGVLGSQGIVLPLVTPVRYGGPRVGDVTLLFNGKNILLLRSMGMLAFGTGVLCDVTALETKETSCHTTERVALEELCIIADRAKRMQKSKAVAKACRAKEAIEMQGSATDAFTNAASADTIHQMDTDDRDTDLTRKSAGSTSSRWNWLPKYRCSITVDDYTCQDYSLAGLFTHPDARRAIADLLIKFIFVLLCSSSDASIKQSVGSLNALYDKCLRSDANIDSGKVAAEACLLTHYKNLDKGQPMERLRRETLKAAIVLFHLLSPCGWEIREEEIFPLFSGAQIHQRSFVFVPTLASNVSAESCSATVVAETSVSVSAVAVDAKGNTQSGNAGTSVGTSKGVAPEKSAVTTQDIADELAELGLDAEDVSVDLTALAQSRAEAHNKALEEGLARPDLVSIEQPLASGPAGLADIDENGPLELASLRTGQVARTRTSSLGDAYGSVAFSLVLSSAFESGSAVLSTDEQDVLKALAITAMKRSIEHGINCISIGDALPQTLADVEAVFAEQERTVYIDTGDKTQWQSVLMEKKMQILFTVKPGPRVYSYSHSKVQWDMYTYPSFAYELIWTTIQADLLVFASEDEERFSVQSLPAVMRNIFCEAASAPFGYPLRQYGLIEI